MRNFITYAHRGASEYFPENTMLSFRRGFEMGANGVETDLHLSRDGVLMLFHDDTLARVTGEEGSIESHTLAELKTFRVKKGELSDEIPTFAEFLDAFSALDVTFAIELKGAGCERAAVDMLRKYGMAGKCVVTSFFFDYIKAVKEYAPEFRVGWLNWDFSDENIAALKAIGAEEVCPFSKAVTGESVAKWHALGFNVRAWGIGDEQIMKAVYDAGVDGMTANFPDKLLAYVRENSDFPVNS